jgi:hypothetical protein
VPTTHCTEHAAVRVHMPRSTPCATLTCSARALRYSKKQTYKKLYSACTATPTPTPPKDTRPDAGSHKHAYNPRCCCISRYVHSHAICSIRPPMQLASLMVRMRLLQFFAAKVQVSSHESPDT